VKRIGVRNRKAVRVSAPARLLPHRSDRAGAHIIQEADHVQAYDKLGGLLAEECELLARQCRGEADRFDGMAEAEPEDLTWPRIGNWMRNRARLLTEWAAEESLRQAQFTREQRTGGG
jgi:hypothetical protein